VVGRAQQEHPFLYWEFGPQTAIRVENWKGIQPKPKAEWELYDLSCDPSEQNNLAEQHPDRLVQMKKFAAQSHQPVRPGTFTTEVRHQRDRQAKWGTAKQPPRPQRGKRGKPNCIKEKNRVPVEQVKLLRASSENRANDRLAKYAIDGNPQTVWHTQFSGGLAQHPHRLVLDLGRERTLQGVRYLARQDNSWNGAFGKTTFSVSSSPDAFPDPALSTTFEKTRAVQSANFVQPVQGRYLQIEILSEVNGQAWASAADIGVIEK